jgi:hypothetical protein
VAQPAFRLCDPPYTPEIDSVSSVLSWSGLVAFAASVAGVGLAVEDLHFLLDEWRDSIGQASLTQFRLIASRHNHPVDISSRVARTRSAFSLRIDFQSGPA